MGAPKSSAFRRPRGWGAMKPSKFVTAQAAGYEGQFEVEIFSERNWWKRDPHEVVRVVKERFQTAV